MNPLEQRIKALEDKFKSLQSSTTIPYDVDGAFRKRLSRNLGLTLSVKPANSEDVQVTESGSGVYDVMGDPDGFLEVDINGVVYYLPYFS